MKIALYIEDGLEQIVLTPESKVERDILAKLDNRSIDIKHGSFYECRGGYVRYTPSYRTSSMYSPSERSSDESTMIVLRSVPDEAPPPKDIQG